MSNLSKQNNPQMSFLDLSFDVDELISSNEIFNLYSNKENSFALMSNNKCDSNKVFEPEILDIISPIENKNSCFTLKINKRNTDPKANIGNANIIINNNINFEFSPSVIPPNESDKYIFHNSTEKDEKGYVAHFPMEIENKKNFEHYPRKGQHPINLNKVNTKKNGDVDHKNSKNDYGIFVSAMKDKNNKIQPKETDQNILKPVDITNYDEKKFKYNRKSLESEKENNFKNITETNHQINIIKNDPNQLPGSEKEIKPRAISINSQNENMKFAESNIKLHKLNFTKNQIKHKENLNNKPKIKDTQNIEKSKQKVLDKLYHEQNKNVSKKNKNKNSNNDINNSRKVSKEEEQRKNSTNKGKYIIKYLKNFYFII